MKVSTNQPITLKIVMVTYNQERYISKAIDSVLMQKTDFTYQLVIGDDCSTDSTPKICMQYVDKHPDKIILIRNSKNIGLLENYKQILDGYPAKYIAILEGDDYWTDVYKIQSQLNLLKTNPHIGLVHTDCDLLFESGKLQKGSHHRFAGLIKNGDVFEQLLYENYIRPATVMFKQDLYNKYVPIEQYISMGFKTLDYPMWLDISFHTQFFYINYSTAVYRIHGSSISNSSRYDKTTVFFKSIYEIKSYALEKFKRDKVLSYFLKNRCLIDQLSIDMEYRQYNNAYKSAKSITIRDFKSFVLRLIATNKFLIDLYAHYLKYRGASEKLINRN